MIHLDPRDARIIETILEKYPYEFYAFGSRVTGKQRPLSDLDLSFLEAIPFSDLSQIMTEFEESDLPFKVDIVDYNKCSENFKKIIKQDMILLEFRKQKNA
jgi:predicted nucleotidyltransferase